MEGIGMGGLILGILYRRRYFPEAFVWHVFYSLAKALCVLMQGGVNKPRQGWKEILHLDLKPPNSCVLSFPLALQTPRR